MLIDFTEIPQSNGNAFQQDIFEKFCRDFLQSLGYTIISEPARGADGGIDIKVEELRTGIGGITKVHWLVSCKHYAHSGGSITKSIESDIRDRVERYDCEGFIGFYTTIAATSLQQSLDALTGKMQYQLFDNEKIERFLIGVKTRENLFMSYFPESYKKWKDLYFYQEPVKLLDAYVEHKSKVDMEKQGGLKKIVELFGTTAEAIKQIRSNESVVEALESEKIQYSIIPEFSNSMFDKSFPEIWDIVRDILKGMGEDPEMVKKYRQFSIGTYGQINYILYSNRLMVCQEFADELDEAFSEIKDMLT